MLTWELNGNWRFHAAKLNGRIVGSVIEREPGDVVWYISAVHMKWVAKGEGESKDVQSAKRALARAWNSWLKAFGPQQVPHATTT
jgi:hypothetical protein